MPQARTLALCIVLICLSLIPTASQPPSLFEIVPMLPVPNVSYYGMSLEFSGDLLLVGAPYANMNNLEEAGFVDVYLKSVSPQGWRHVQRLLSPNPKRGDSYGSAIAVSGDTVIIAANGHVGWLDTDTTLYIYTRVGTELQYGGTALTNPLASNGAINNENIGRELEFDGHHLIATDGPVVAYTYEDGIWSNGVEVPHPVIPGHPGMTFHSDWRIDLSGDRLLLGFPHASLSNPMPPSYDGVLAEYHYDGAGWVQTQTYFSPDGDLTGFGSPETCDDGTVFVGAFGYNLGQGALYEFTHNGTSLVNTGNRIDNPGPPETYARFGEYITCREGLAVVSAWADNNGKVYVFAQTATGWEHQATFPAPTPYTSLFGYESNIDSGIVVAAQLWYEDAQEAPDNGPGRVWNTYGPTILPSLNVENASANEPDTGQTTSLTFTVAQSHVSLVDTTFAYSLSDVSTAAGDFDHTGGNGTIPAGQTSATITVPIYGDDSDEPDENFTLTLTGISNATPASLGATGTILDDDEPPPTPQLSVSAASAFESAGTLDITVSQDVISVSDVTFTLTVDSGVTDSATADVDFTAFTTAGTIDAGDLSETFIITLLDDTDDEPDETFSATLSNPSNAIILSGEAVAIILDDDEPVIPPIETVLIENSGFEGSARGLTAPWTTINATSDKVVCNSTNPPKTVSYAGNCAFRFNGGTGATTLKQVVPAANLPVVLEPMGQFRFSLMYSTNSASPQFVAKTMIILSGGGRIVLKPTGFVQSTVNGVIYIEASAGMINLSELSASSPLKLKIILKHASPSGKVFVDDVLPVYIAPDVRTRVLPGLVPPVLRSSH